MKHIKNKQQISTITLFTVLVSIVFNSCSSLPKLSKEENRIINTVLKAPIPEIIHGETGFAQSQGYNIWFESILPTSAIKGTVILIMGNGNDALTWPPKFISNITNAGYQVVRFDHRDTGLSTSKEKWRKKNAYSLKGMAGDVVAILDKLQIEKAHIVGVSMGGMIAQIVAIDYTERTESLSSIMSSGDPFDPTLPIMSKDIIPDMVKTIFKYGFFGEKKGQVKRQIIQRRILMGSATGTINIKTAAEIAVYNLKKRKGYSIIAAKHHYQAILKAPSRYLALSKSEIPTLVIHGYRDPVMPILHSEKLVEIIPNSKALWIQNMGHDLPDSALKEITDEMISNFNRKR